MDNQFDSNADKNSLIISGFFIMWIAGVVVAEGWYKILAIFFPPYCINSLKAL